MTIPAAGALAPQTLDATGSGATKRRLDALDTLRGLSALMVVFFHMNYSFLLYNLPIIRHSYLFVDFFFVLSGFIMYYNYGRLPDTASFSQFIGMRLFRLYPLHFALLVAFVGCDALYAVVRFLRSGSAPTTASGDYVFDLILNLLLMNGLTIRPLSFNIPSWSISTEFWTYVLFGSIVLVFRNVRRYAMAIIFASVCLAALFAIYMRYGAIAGFTLFLFPRCIFGFFLGAAMGTVVSPGKCGSPNTNSPIAALSQGVAVIVAVTAVTIVGFGRLTVLLPVLFAAVIGTFVIWPQTRLTKLLVRPRLLWLGQRSYSVYMVHWFVLMQVGAVLRNVFHVPVVAGQYELGPAIGLAVSVLSIALVLIVASQTYRYIEQPGRRLGRRVLNMNRSPQSLNSTAPSPRARRYNTGRS